LSNGAKIGVACGVLFLAGVIYYVRAGNVNDLTSNTTYNTQLRCLACNEEFKAKLDVVDKPPFKCPKCQKSAAWFLWECDKCHATFAPPLEGNPPRQPMMPTCPKCGSTSTGRASIQG
jgi:predicted RNA-binding Zn-ribbon protein involved in translation (DUF1610 family)